MDDIEQSYPNIFPLPFELMLYNYLTVINVGFLHFIYGALCWWWSFEFDESVTFRYTGYDVPYHTTISYFSELFKFLAKCILVRFDM